MKHFLIASILLTVIPALAFQATPPQTAGFAVSGKVLQDPDGQPVKKANVTLIGQSGRQTGPYSAVTDAEGQFAIANVKAGRYIVEIEHAGMVQNGNGRISLSVVQNKNDLVFRVQRAALIIGKITDSDGDPVRNVSVTATRLDSGRPANRYASFGSGTNDLGEFRIPDLRAGKYTVVATPPQGLQAPEPDEKGKAREQVVYVATYYPGTLDKEESLPVDVQAGSETPVDITILSSKSYRVTGEVVGLPSKSLISTILLTSGHDMNSQQRLEEGGRFEFTGLLPGTYHARAVVVTGLREGGTPDMRLMQLEPTIDVVNADITEMHLHAVPAASIYGRFRMDTGQKFDWTRVMVFLRRDVSDRDMQMMESFGGPSFSTVKPDGTFELKDVVPGNYYLVVGAAGSSEELRDYYTKSVILDGQEVGDSGFRVSADISLQVVVSAKGAAIEGTVVDEAGKPVPYASVVDVPGSEHRSRGDLYQQDTTDEHGHFSLRGLNPGTYTVLALEDLHEDVQNPDFLNSYSSRGEKIDLDEGSHTSVVVKVISSTTP